MVLLPDKAFEVRKHPTAERTYGFDWDDLGYLEVGETITASTWSITPSGQLAYTEPAQNATQTGAKFTGGLHGKNYRVTNSIVTTTGKDSRSFTVKVSNR